MDLRTYRKRAKLTLDELGSRLGVTGATVQRWEVGKLRIPLHAAVKLQDISDGEITAGELAALYPEPAPSPAPASA